MSTVAIVDADAKGLASSLNGIAKKEGHPIHYSAIDTPDRLFDRLAAEEHCLILLHHTWEGLSIGQLLERIRSITTKVRVIVFTGREPNLRELIECVRFGVCDYWLKRGTIDATAWSRKIGMFCASETYTLETLGRPSGSTLELLKEADINSGKIATLQTQKTALEAELTSSRSEENRETRKSVYRMIEYTVCILLLGLVYWFAATRTSQNSALILVGIFAVFFLFLQGRIALAIFDWKKGTAQVSAEARSLRKAKETPPPAAAR